MNAKLLVIVGETTSGKSAMALRLAQQFNGEIICADSSTVRSGADIGTAKPSAEERALVPHHLLDVVGPNEEFTAAQFKEQATQAMADISARGKVPIMVGGTGLYINAVLYDYSFLPPVAGVDRQELNQLTNTELLDRIASMGLDTEGLDTQNNRRLIRFIETGGIKPTMQPLRENSLVLGLKIDKELLRERIVTRIDDMLSAGLKGEVTGLVEAYGWDCPALMSVGYSEWRAYTEGGQSLEKTRQMIIKDTKDLAKRQRTWFKRNKSIQWFSTPVEWTDVVDSVTTFLAN